MGITVNGMNELMAKFEELEKKAQKDIGTRALNKAGDLVKQSMIDKAPELTGALKGSIDKGKITGSGANQKIKIGNMNAGGDVKRYLFYQNYGTSILIGEKFIENGFNDSVSEANKIIIETVEEELL